MNNDDKIIIDLTFDETDESLLKGIIANSIVKDPAVNYEAYFFSDDLTLFADDLKYEIESVMMVPEMLIPKRSAVGLVYYRFSRDVVDKSLNYFMQSGKQNIISFDHTPGSHINDPDRVYLKSIYQIDEATKTDRYINLPHGTIIARYKFIDKELYHRLKEDDFKGFSIEYIGQIMTDIEPILDTNLKGVEDIVNSSLSYDEQMKELRKLLFK